MIAANPKQRFRYSGHPWLGDIPEHWDTRRLRGVAELVMGQSPSSDDCSEAPVGLPFLQGCAEFGDFHPSPVQFCSSPPRVALAGTILMSVRAPVGRLNIADQDYGIGRGLCGIIPNGITLFDNFAYYQLQVIEDALRLVSTGSTYEAVSTGDVRGQIVVIPTLAEQTVIVAYLDYADQLLRGGVSQKLELAELMEEYKRAVIQQAVTRGLDPDVPLKPSGVEWFGDIPEHWEVRRLKTVADMRVSNIDKHINDDEIPVRLCNYVDVYKNDLIDGTIDFMSASATEDEISRFHLRIGDVLITKDSETWDDIGVPALVVETAPDLVSGYHLALLRPDTTQLLGSYLFRALQSRAVVYQFHVEARGVTRYGLSHSGILSAVIPLPPVEEQAAIVAHLDKLTSDIEAAIADTRREIELLEEYRTRLIADVVTGKLDVREAAANLPDVNLDDIQPLAEGGEADD